MQFLSSPSAAPHGSDGQPKIWLQKKMPRGLSIPSFVGQMDGSPEGSHRLKPAAEHPPGDVEWLKCSGLFMDHSFANTSSFSDVSAHPASKLQRTIFQTRRQNARMMVVRDRCLEFSDVSLERSRSSTRGRYMSFNFHVHSRAEDRAWTGELKLSHYNKETFVKQ